jgi:hypothetical protein
MLQELQIMNFLSSSSIMKKSFTFEGEPYAGGTMESLIQIEYLAKLTEKRIKQLNFLQ